MQALWTDWLTDWLADWLTVGSDHDWLSGLSNWVDWLTQWNDWFSNWIPWIPCFSHDWKKTTSPPLHVISPERLQIFVSFSHWAHAIMYWHLLKAPHQLKKGTHPILKEHVLASLSVQHPDPITDKALFALGACSCQINSLVLSFTLIMKI